MIQDGVDNATKSADALKAGLKPTERIEPASPQIAMGRFVRDDRRVLLFVNVGAEPYEGVLRTEAEGSWLALDPATGKVGEEPESLRLNLNPRETVILVQMPAE